MTTDTTLFYDVQAIGRAIGYMGVFLKEFAESEGFVQQGDELDNLVDAIRELGHRLGDRDLLIKRKDK